MTLLAVWLILMGLRPFIDLGDLWRLSDVLALVAGVLLLLGR
ncbi:MAG: hypothetical protein PHN82_00295 [bacterium]|nr:hypothetical protein [bacterium]